MKPLTPKQAFENGVEIARTEKQAKEKLEEEKEIEKFKTYEDEMGSLGVEIIKY